MNVPLTMVAVRTNAAIQLAVITASVWLARSWRKMAEDVKVTVRTVCLLIREGRTSVECKGEGLSFIQKQLKGLR